MAHAPRAESDRDTVRGHTFDGIWASASLVHLAEADAVDVLGQFARLVRPAGKLFACVMSEGETGWRDEPDGRRYYTVWEADRFAAAVERAEFTIDEVARGPFVEVRATRADR